MLQTDQTLITNGCIEIAVGQQRVPDRHKSAAARDAGIVIPPGDFYDFFECSFESSDERVVFYCQSAEFRSADVLHHVPIKRRLKSSHAKTRTPRIIQRSSGSAPSWS